MRTTLHALAAEIGAEALGETKVEVIPLTGRGTVNHVFHVAGSSDRVVVRLNSESHRMDEFRKEQWAMLRAREQGVATPDVLTIGRQEDVSYQVQTYVDGEHPDSQDLIRWEELGEVLSRVHRASVDGWRQAQNWGELVRYGLSQLGPQDPLRRHGLLDAYTSSSLGEIWEGQPDLPVGLCHGDVAMRNVLVDPGGRLVLLDWGCASVGVVPLADVKTVVGESDPNGPAMTAFFQGYGTRWDDLLESLTSFATLKAVDLCRWAIDQRPKELPRCLKQARWALGFYLDREAWQPRPSGESAAPGPATDGMRNYP